MGYSIRPVGNACNLNCKYCYTYGSYNQKYDLISIDVIKKIFNLTINEFYKNLDYINSIYSKKDINKVKKYNPRFLTLEYAWHGGEPLLAGLDFYKNIINLQKDIFPKNIHFVNKIQTNGTLINEDYSKFFKKNNFAIGVSLDGPKFINDKYRVNKNNFSSFNQVIKGINLLKKNKNKFNVLSTLNNFTINKIKPINYIDFYNNLNVDLQINLMYPVGRGKNIVDNNLVNKYVQFLYDCFNYYLENKKITIKDFDSYIDAIFFNMPLPNCRFTTSCITKDNMLGINNNGDIYLCNRFVGLEKHKLGNIKYINDLKEIYNIKNKLYNSYKINDCKNCYLKNNSLCAKYGGCIYAQELLGSDPLCTVTNKLFNKIKKIKDKYVI